MIEWWLDTLGRTLEFLSFWFVPPNILGSGELARLRTAAAAILRAVPFILTALSAALILSSYAIHAIFFYPFLVQDILSRLDISDASLATGILSALLWTVELTMLFYVSSRVVRLIPSTVVAVRENAVSRLLGELAERRDIRERLMRIGAILFSLGFILQTAAHVFPR